MTTPPASAMAMPTITRIELRSRSRTAAPMATKMGFDVTMTTELATEVCSSEAIQKAKWAARQTADASTRAHCRRVSERSAPHSNARPRGTTTTAASASRYAAMVSDGASARRMMTAAEETAETPSARPPYTTGAGGWPSQPDAAAHQDA